MKAYAVIGANYGDEGKGLITDVLAHAVDASIVVRANGGAQAGHTVCRPDGRRHVFHHFGAGTFENRTTFLAREFVCNPILFNQEYEVLRDFGLRPRVLIDLRCRITTPWDMMTNQALEDKRGKDRHGSCGVGFNITIERCLEASFRLTAADLEQMPPSLLLQRCHRIRTHLAGKLMMQGIMPKWSYNDDPYMEPFLRDVALFQARTAFTGQHTLRNHRLVFEGAQGLALDMNNKEDYPYLTRSNTGIRNPLTICAELDIDELHAVYVTRSYLTRHGAGPLPDEDTHAHFFDVPEDKTNVDHPYQGKLRLAPLELTALKRRIDKDLAIDTMGVDRWATLAVTHLDLPLGSFMCVQGEDAFFTKKAEVFADLVAKTAGLPLRYRSAGDTSKCVEWLGPDLQ